MKIAIVATAIIISAIFVAGMLLTAAGLNELGREANNDE